MKRRMRKRDLEKFDIRRREESRATIGLYKYPKLIYVFD